MAAPVINWRAQAGPLKIFKGNRRKAGERKRGMEKGKREKWREERKARKESPCYLGL